MLHLLREDPERGSGQIHVRWGPLENDLDVEGLADRLRENSERVRKENPGLEVLERERIVNLKGRVFVTSAVREGETAAVYYYLLEGRSLISLAGLFPAARLASCRRTLEDVARSLSVEESVTNETGEKERGGAAPERLEDLVARGQRLASRGDHEGAIAAYEAALALRPDRVVEADLFYRLSSEHLEAGIKPYLERRDGKHYEKSLECAKECLRLCPGLWLPMGNIGTVHMNRGEMEEALRWFEEADKVANRSDPRYQQLSTHHRLVRTVLDTKKEKASGGRR